MPGDFFLDDYKSFPFKEGDLLASRRSDGKFAANKILKIDKFAVKKGESILIQSRAFTATEADFLLVISTSYGEAEFDSLERARAAAISGNWSVKLAHEPNRPPGAAVDQTYIGNAPVRPAELAGYQYWRQAFDNGEAGIF